MSAIPTLRRMPLSLQILVGVLTIAPLLSFWYLGSPWQLWADEPTAESALAIATYWVAPWLTVLSLVSRSILALPLLAGLGIGLLSLITVTGEGWARGLSVSLVAVMFLTSLALLRRDILYPYFMRRQRYWRRFSRSNVNFSVSLYPLEADAGTATPPPGLPAVVHDCSIGGLGLSAELQGFEEASFRKPGSRLRIVTRDGQALTATVAAARPVDPVYQVGVSVDDPRAMEALILAIPKHANRSFSFELTRLWARESVRRSVMALWVFSIIYSFIMQSFYRELRGIADFGAAEDADIPSEP